MKRNEFVKRLGLSAFGSLGILTTSCKSDEDNEVEVDPAACTVSPEETAGPFPIKSPADFVRENIIGDREGIPLLINISIENTNDNCNPLVGVMVDIWHCDASGNYSEYDDQLDGDFTGQHFLRGRQVTNSEGRVSFLSIYPGWYPGRAPHLHLEVLDAGGRSLLVTQTAFPEDISRSVYETSGYKGAFDTSNQEDGVFGAGLNRSMADTVTGSTSEGYVLNEIVKVAG